MNKLAENFTQPGVAAMLTFFAALLAILISILSIYLSVRANRKIQAIEVGRDQKELELSKTADIVLSQTLFKEEDSNTPSLGSDRQGILTITNTGQAAAEGIRLYLSNPRSNDFLVFQSDEGEQVDKIKPFTVGPRSSVNLMYVQDVRVGFPNFGRVTWYDLRDGKHEYKSSL